MAEQFQLPGRRKRKNFENRKTNAMRFNVALARIDDEQSDSDLVSIKDPLLNAMP